jgi:serine/threonine protein kinase
MISDFIETPEGVHPRQKVAEDRPVSEPPRRVSARELDLEKQMDALARGSLTKEGYEIMGIVDDGQMRDVYHVKRRLGEAQQDFLAKVPKKEVTLSETSVQTHIAFARQDNWEQREVQATNHFSHPNVARVFHTIPLQDGRQVNVEEYIPGSVNLRRKIEKTGPLRGKMLRHYLEGFLNGLQHIHASGFVHGDIKPENAVIVPDEERPMWVDFQTARDKWAGFGPLATRGAVNYSSREVVNGVFDSRHSPGASRLQNDVYGFGGLTYFLLTGEDPGKLSMEIDPTSNSFVELNDDTQVPFTLFDNGKALKEGITKSQHQKQIKELDKKMRTQKISRPYRDFVTRCMLPEDDRRAFTNMNEVAAAYKKLDLDVIQRFKERAGEETLRGIKAGLWTALGVGIPTLLIGSCAYLGVLKEDPSFPVRSMQSGAMQQEDHRNFDLIGLDSQDKFGAYRDLAPTIEQVISKLPDLEKSKAWKDLDVEHAINYAHDIRAMNRRLASALVRTIMLHNDTETCTKYKADGDERFQLSLSPKRFLPSWFSKSEEENPEGNYRYLPHSVSYLRDCVTHDYEAADTFARYFSGEEKMRRAIDGPGGTTYFDKYDKQGNLISEGYRKYLPGYQREMIDTAVLLYHTTDEETLNVNYNRMRFLSKQYGPDAKPIDPDPSSRWEQPAYGGKDKR